MVRWVFKGGLLLSLSAFGFMALAQDSQAEKTRAEAVAKQEAAANAQADDLPEGVDPLNVIGRKVQAFHQNSNFQGLAEYLAVQLKQYDQMPGLWFQYGYARHMTGNYEASYKAWKKIEGSEFPNRDTLMFNLACASSLLNKIDEAFVYLNKAVDMGFSADMIAQDSDLANLRKDERYAAVLAKAKGEQ